MPVLLPSWIAPETALRALAATLDNVFWLDGGDAASSGWSFVGAGTRANFDDIAQTPLAPTTPLQGGPFQGGWVGWLDYESGAAALGVAVSHRPAEPRWMTTDVLISFDHSAHECWVVRGDADEIARLVTDTLPEHAPRVAQTVVATANVTPVEHAAAVAACREFIRAGEAYQLCLTTQFHVAGAFDEVQVMTNLREATASHHAGFVRIAGTSIVSGSPEQFLTIENRTVRTKPIKGTRPRGATPERDAELAAELVASDKERAENVMIVDLMRNDLSRVCTPESIRVDALWAVESYPTVHQLVSTVAGDVRDGVTIGDLVAAAFPAGSMTGAPKRRAMQLLHGLEQHPRGIYSGCFGWIGANGDADLAMVIRTIVLTEDGASIGSGGGITWGSVPADEVAEVGVKVRAPLAALGAVPPAGW